MVNLNELSLESDKYPGKEQIKFIPDLIRNFARSKDVHYLSKLIQKISEESSVIRKNERWSDWYSKYQKSYEMVSKKNDLNPHITYPNLPIRDSVAEIKKGISSNQFLIIEGATGSGKTTQIPKICVDMGLGGHGLIGVTQPRRIAARSVAERIADEIESKIGDFVGWQIRFDKQLSSTTTVKVMTDGLLLSEINKNQFLNDYKVIIIDEAHERSLNIDFLLGYLWRIRDKRPDLKVIISSATIDAQKFSRFFNNAPILKVSGRTFPVDIKYVESDEENDPEKLMTQSVLTIIQNYDEKDILIFLSTEREINETLIALKKLRLNQFEILPLFSRLSTREQNKIFVKSNKRRIILSTNIAETSITVPNIGFVIDVGRARISRYSFRNKVQRLPIESISKASANQRAGRCGRIMAGTCFRLYSESDYESRPDFTDPEILRTSLASVILKMLSLNIGTIENFSFVDKPDSRLVSDGYQLLTEIKAITPTRKLTKIGRSIANLQIEPRLAVMLLEAARLDVLTDVLIIVAGLSVQNPMNAKSSQIDNLSFIDQCKDKDSDFVSILNLWSALKKERERTSRSKFAKFCKQNHISILLYMEWSDLIAQLKDTLISMGYTFKNQSTDGDNIHKAILAGVVTQIGVLEGRSQYKGTRNRVFSIFPGSGASNKAFKWIMAASLFETSKQYALNVAKIDNRWVGRYADHLIKKQHGEPFYNKRIGAAAVKETQLLFGLPVITDKLVSYEVINPKLSRTIFIREALVHGLYEGKGKFFENNKELIKDLEEKENRFRTRDILLDDKIIYDFYDKQVPIDVLNLKSFEKWRVKVEINDPEKLFLSPELISSELPSEEKEAQFPKFIDHENTKYLLEYKFDPGHPDDGISIKIPLSILHQTPKYLFEWLVPGMLEEKCIEMVKALPKRIRKQFVPIPESVNSVRGYLKAKNEPLTRVLGEKLFALKGIKVDPDSWDIEKIDPWYRASFHLVDENNELIESSKNLIDLKLRYKGSFKKNLIDEEVKEIEKDYLYSWDFDDLPEEVSFKKDSLTLKAWPALIDREKYVAIKLFDDPVKAKTQSRDGQIRLALLHSRGQLKKISEKLFRGDDLKITAAGFNSKTELIESILFASFNSTIFKDGDIVRSRVEFEEILKNQLSNTTRKILFFEIWFKSLLPLLHECRRKVNKLPNQFKSAIYDVNTQLEFLFKKTTLMDAEDTDLEQYPKYLKAILIRIEKIPRKSKDDEIFMNQINDLLDRVSSANTHLNDNLLFELRRLRWLIEELRVSLFAQQLKTREPVSSKRILKKWESLQDKLSIV